MKTKDLTKTIIGIGVIAGIRSMAAPAIISDYFEKHQSKRLRKSRFNFMQSHDAAKILKVLALGEAFGDKLPFIPARIKLSPLLGRGLSGALSGATLAQSKKQSIIKGGALGLTAALASTYVFYFLRKKLAKNFAVPDFVWGLAEDGLVLNGSQRLLHAR